MTSRKSNFGWPMGQEKPIGKKIERKPDEKVMFRVRLDMSMECSWKRRVEANWCSVLSGISQLC